MISAFFRTYGRVVKKWKLTRKCRFGCAGWRLIRRYFGAFSPRATQFNLNVQTFNIRLAVEPARFYPDFTPTYRHLPKLNHRYAAVYDSLPFFLHGMAAHPRRTRTRIAADATPSIKCLLLNPYQLDVPLNPGKHTSTDSLFYLL